MAGLVNEGFGNKLGLSCVVLRALTAVVNSPGAFQVMSIVAPEAVAVTGELDAFSACARAAATWPGLSLTGCPVQAELLLGPKQAVAVNPPTFSVTVTILPARTADRRLLI